MTFKEHMEQLLPLAYKDRAVPTEKKAIASDLGLNPSAYSNYMGGHRRPDEESAARIGMKLAARILDVHREGGYEELASAGLELNPPPETPITFEDLRGQIVERLAGSAAVARMKPDFFTALMETRQGLKISTLKYGKIDSFLSALVRSYLGRVGIKDEVAERTTFFTDEDLASGDVHLAACYFASARRSLKATFLPTPLRTSLAAIYQPQVKMSFEDVASAVSEFSPSTRLILPLVVEGEVGQYYVCDQLNFREENIEFTKTLEVDELRERLHKLTEKHLETPGSPVPVLILNEYAAILVAQNDPRFCCAVPLTTSANNKRFSDRRKLPLFHVSLACARSETAFFSFLNESWNHYLSTEVETTSWKMAELLTDVEKEVYEAAPGLPHWTRGKGKAKSTKLSEAQRREIARQYALFTLNIDRESMRDLSAIPRSWHRILHRTAELVAERLANPSILSKQISAVLADGPQQEQIETPEQVECLANYTNLDLYLDEVRGMETEALIKYLEQRLLNPGRKFIRANLIHVDSEIEIHNLRPEEVFENQIWRNATVRLLSQLAEDYRNLRDPISTDGGPNNDNPDDRKIGRSIASNLGNEIGAKMTRYSRIFLAIEEGRVPAGIICVLDMPGSSTKDVWEPAENSGVHSDQDILKHSCELRYLWIPGSQRNRRIGHLLIGYALRWAKENKKHRCRAAALPQLETAVTRLEEMGFARTAPLAYDHATAPLRLIFEKLFI